MEKYSQLLNVTNEFLHGNIFKIVFEYTDTKDLQLTVQYKYDNKYWFDYDMNIDMAHEKVDFVSHRSEAKMESVRLSRDLNFEHAVSDIFFTAK